MAAKKKSRKKPTRRKTTRKPAATATRRKRRTPEELIADLKAKIREVENRAAAKELKQSPAIRKALLLIRNTDKVTELAAEEKNTALQHALADAREPLAAFIADQGLRLPKGRRPRGRRPAGA